MNGSGGNVNVAGNLKMDGNARVEGTATAKGNVDLSGGSPRITGALNALGTLHVANAGITLNNATVNGNATVEGSTLTGVLTTAGDFTNTGWGNEPTSVLYGGKYTNTGTRDYNSISHKTNVTPLPATTGDPLPMPIINIDKYQLSSYGKKIIPSKGTYTVNNGSPQFTDSQVYLDGNMSFSGGPNLMKLPPNMSWYINGDFNSSCNTTLTGTDVTLYVKGNINIGGTFNFNATGKVIIIADGTINIGGGYNFGNTNVVLMSKTAITIGRNTPINAQIYVHSSDPSKKGVFTANSPDIRGAVICDQAVFTGNGNTFTYKPPSYPFLPPGNDDTGDTTRAWSVASWELLF
ncbi:MAG TPA: polymer-forming cytoskeletal protein [Armatimonadota bacterium]|nr:polymer-forming cytoskeletal protein [Armatimonadota bacterium]